MSGVVLYPNRLERLLGFNPTQTSRRSRIYLLAIDGSSWLLGDDGTLHDVFFFFVVVFLSIVSGQPVFPPLIF